MARNFVGALVKVIDASLPRNGEFGVVVVDDRSSCPYKLLFEDGQDVRGNWFSRDAVQVINTADAPRRAASILQTDARRRAERIAKFSASHSLPSDSSGSGSGGSSSSSSTQGASSSATSSTTSSSSSSNSRNRTRHSASGPSALAPGTLELPPVSTDQLEIASRLKEIESFLGQSTPEEQDLAREVIRHGGLIKAYPGLRSDGVRGLMAPKALRAGEPILCIPRTYVMHFDVARPSVKSAIAEELAASGMGASSPMERGVYEQMISLCVELMLEREIILRGPSKQSLESGGSGGGGGGGGGGRGEAAKDPSFWRAYVTSLPSPPDTINRYSPLDRALYTTLLEHDLLKMYSGLIDVITGTLKRVADFKAIGAAPPDRAAVQDEFFFILSRLSYLRLIPYIDLANAALPDEHNVRIHQDKASGNCYLHALRDIAPGEELCIDYNHRNGVSLMASYGFTMGLEKTRSSFKVKVDIRPFLRAYKAEQHGGEVHLLSNRPANTGGLPAEALLVLRMGALGSEEEMLKAAQLGYFQERYLTATAWPAALTPRFQRWREMERVAYGSLRAFCQTKKSFYSTRMDPLLDQAKGVDRDSWTEDYDFFTHEAIIDQVKTDKLMLARLEQFLELNL